MRSTFQQIHWHVTLNYSITQSPLCASFNTLWNATKYVHNSLSMLKVRQENKIITVWFGTGFKGKEHLTLMGWKRSLKKKNPSVSESEDVFFLTRFVDKWSAIRLKGTHHKTACQRGTHTHTHKNIFPNISNCIRRKMHFCHSHHIHAKNFIFTFCQLLHADWKRIGPRVDLIDKFSLNS